MAIAMASSSSSSLSLLYSLLFLILAIGANARPGAHFHPCNTLFVSSSFTKISFYPHRNPNNNYPHFPLNPNQNGNPRQQQQQQRFFAIVDYLTRQQELQQQQPSDSQVIFATVAYPRGPFIDSRDFLLPQSTPLRRFNGEPHSISSSVGVTSLRERSKDILSVVAALLFGVGCGAFTSAILYLAWSLITNHQEDENDTDTEDAAGLKKMGYCKIPDQAPAVTTIAPPAAKDVV